MNERQKKLLKLIVNEYVKTARPVSSSALEKNLKCSSATVRNEMANLEDLGYLEKTHISSGRIPSEKGYRYYADNLMEPKEMTGDDMLKLQTIFHNNSLEISDAISKSLEIISELTNYTTVVLGKSSHENKLQQVEIVPISFDRVIAIIITDRGHVENKSINLPPNCSIDEVKKIVELINKLLIGTSIDKVSEKLEFEIKPIISQYVSQYKVLYEAFYNAFSDFSNKSNSQFCGRNNFLKQPEFNTIDKIKNIFEKFEDENVVRHIEEEENGINIYIGAESEIDDDVTVIKTKYSIDGEEGTIAIIGPKRMDYDRVVAMLDYIKLNLERRKQ